MDMKREGVFPRPGLSGHKNIGVSCGDALGKTKGLLHRFGLRNDLDHSVLKELGLIRESRRQFQSNRTPATIFQGHKTFAPCLQKRGR